MKGVDIFIRDDDNDRQENRFHKIISDDNGEEDKDDEDEEPGEMPLMKKADTEKIRKI